MYVQGLQLDRQTRIIAGVPPDVVAMVTKVRDFENFSSKCNIETLLDPS